MTLDWDAWRAAYPTLTVADQQAFYDEAYRQYPDQRHYDLDAALEAFAQLDPVTVVELGGWTGDLAAGILAQNDRIASWANYEISGEAVAHGVCTDPRYSATVANRWFWELDLKADCLVASHVIEHLSDTHFDLLASTFGSYDSVILVAPLTEEGQGWAGYEGSHILGYGWVQVEEWTGAPLGVRGETRWYR